jgi:putative SbcD/Mre11-related phosphoesterase
MATEMCTRVREVAGLGLMAFETWLLTPYRAAVHLPTRTAVIADLHLGYAEARQQSGEAVPQCGLAETKATLKRLLQSHEVLHLIIAGDLIENGLGEPAAAALVHWLRAQGLVSVGLVPGNHDQGAFCQPGCLEIHREGYGVGEWRIVHGDGPMPGEKSILGHHHPSFRWSGRITAPCYLIGTSQIIVPAFSADAKGLNVFGVAGWSSFRCGVIAGDRVLDFGKLAALEEKRGRRALKQTKG